MRRAIILLLLVLTISCASKEDKINEIIDNSYYGTLNVKKMGDIKKLKEDVYSLPVHYSIVEKYHPVKDDNKYEIARYIYKATDGAYRIYFLIDMTEERVIDKSSNPNDFFKPIATEILGENLGDIEGNNLIELMRY